MIKQMTKLACVWAIALAFVVGGMSQKAGASKEVTDNYRSSFDYSKADGSHNLPDFLKQRQQERRYIIKPNAKTSNQGTANDQPEGGTANKPIFMPSSRTE